MRWGSQRDGCPGTGMRYWGEIKGVVGRLLSTDGVLVINGLGWGDWVGGLSGDGDWWTPTVGDADAGIDVRCEMFGRLIFCLCLGALCVLHCVLIVVVTLFGSDLRFGLGGTCPWL